MSEWANLFAGASVSLERGFGGIATHGIAVFISASTGNRTERFVLAFRRSKVLVLVSALLNASVLAKNNSHDCFLNALVRISPTYKRHIKQKPKPKIGLGFILAEISGIRV